jgi:hypothetical protein
LKQTLTPKSASTPPADPAKRKTKFRITRPWRNFVDVGLAESTDRVRSLGHEHWNGDESRMKGRKGWNLSNIRIAVIGKERFVNYGARNTYGVPWTTFVTFTSVGIWYTTHIVGYVLVAWGPHKTGGVGPRYTEYYSLFFILSDWISFFWDLGRTLLGGRLVI